MSPELTRLRQLVIEKSRSVPQIQRDLRAGAMTNFGATLEADGTFSDLDSAEHVTAFRRLHVLAAGIATISEETDRARLKLRVYRGLLEYARRESSAPTAFPQGAFAIPRAFLGSWFSLLEEIERDRKDPALRSLLEELGEIGRKVAAQAWIHPDHSPEQFRVEDPVTIDVFRGQAHFVVANFVPYRPVVEYALFLRDERYLDIIEEVAKRSLHEPVNPANPSAGFWTEGIHPDRNITAHGPQTYIFGYGRDYLNGLLNLAELFWGGPRAFLREEFDVLAEVILEAFVWFIYRDQMDYTVLGRHNLYPDSGHDGNQAAAALIDRILAIAGDKVTRKKELLQARDRLKEDGEFSGSKYFWNTEEYVHRAEDFCVVVNISSTRTTGPEIVKPWAEQNFHFANGAMMLYLDGTEYREARGAWHLRALPGITAEYSDEPPPYIHTWNGMRGTDRFAGGVSDGESGACAFVSAIEGEPVQARKAWFFHQNTIVCLGSGVDPGDAEKPVRTTLNQTSWRSPIYLLQNGRKREFPFTWNEALQSSAAAPAGVWHDNVSYLIEAGKGGFTAAVRSTDWVALAEINQGKAAPAEATVFDFFLDHRDADGDSYAYAVRPGTTPEEMAASLASPEWKILANTSQLQAVEFSSGNMVQAVFREAGSVEASRVGIETDRPLIVMLRRIFDGGWAIVYQDPLHQTERTEAELILTIFAADGETSRYPMTLDFPQGLNLGRPVQIEFKP